MPKQQKSFVLFCFLLVGSVTAFPQQSIFEDQRLVDLIKSAADEIYSIRKDSADYYIEEVRKLVPEHPIVPMMEAMAILWYHIPVLDDDVFARFHGRLDAAVLTAQRLPGDNPDGLFFEMSARGLLAEYYADRGAYMKAVSEASQAYSLLKEGFDFADEYPEYLFAVGLYNYFREAYPDKHPIYRPLLWFFRNGDKELGIQQLTRATKETVIIRVEAYVYLSYIFLRYEEKPELSQQYITELYSQFPTNPYVQAKYLESFHSSKKYDQLKPQIISALKANETAYYEMVGNLYGGIVSEIRNKDISGALQEYKVALGLSEQLPGYADYYKSLLHLGLGRVYKRTGQDALASDHLERAIGFAQTREVIEEATKWMSL